MNYGISITIFRSTTLFHDNGACIALLPFQFKLVLSSYEQAYVGMQNKMSYFLSAFIYISNLFQNAINKESLQLLLSLKNENQYIYIYVHIILEKETKSQKPNIWVWTLNIWIWLSISARKTNKYVFLLQPLTLP